MQADNLKIVIVGGVAAGASCAARARRLSESASITMIERGPDVSFANCGLPYHIGGEIEQRNVLQVHTAASLGAMLNIDVRTGTEVVEIDRSGKRVAVRKTGWAEVEWLPYDKLMLAPGATPLRPPLPGIDSPRIHTLRNLQDMDRIRSAAFAAKRVVVVGAGFIGLEMAEQLRRLGAEVDVVELMPQILPQMDADMTAQMEADLRANHITLHLGSGVEAFEAGESSLACVLKGGKTLPADLVVLSIGVRPESGLAVKAGLEVGPRGHIRVNSFMQTSDPEIYAAGDVVETQELITHTATNVPLGGPANRQGRTAATHMVAPEKARPYPGSLGTAIVRTFGTTCGMTGWSRRRLESAGLEYRSVTVKDHHHASYYPGAKLLTLRLFWDPKEGRVLGAQASGIEGVDKRIDVIATAIAGGLCIEDVANLELSYAPPFGSAKDVVNTAGMAALNVEDGLLAQVAGISDDPSVQLVDVRPKPMFDANPRAGFVNIPLPQLRSRLGELDRSRPVVTACAMGKTSYFAARILVQNGFDAKSLPATPR